MPCIGTKLFSTFYTQPIFCFEIFIKCVFFKRILCYLEYSVELYINLPQNVGYLQLQSCSTDTKLHMVKYYFSFYFFKKFISLHSVPNKEIRIT